MTPLERHPHVNIFLKHTLYFYYLIPIKIRAPLNFEHLDFSHPQIPLPFTFRAPLFYCKFAIISFIRGIFSPPFNFHAFVLRELAPLAPCTYCFS